MTTSTRGLTLLGSAAVRRKSELAMGRRRVAKTRHLAREAWSAIMQAVMARREYMSAQAAKLDLTLPQAHVLQFVGTGGGSARTMASIAGALGCDASNITGIVDRLEARGLIERRSQEGDRRIKTIPITRAGASHIAVLKDKMCEPPDGLARLCDEDVALLHVLVRRAFSSLEE